MGKPIDRAARQLLDPALKNITDQKAQVCAEGGSGMGGRGEKKRAEAGFKGKAPEGGGVRRGGSDSGHTIQIGAQYDSNWGPNWGPHLRLGPTPQIGAHTFCYLRSRHPFPLPPLLSRVQLRGAVVEVLDSWASVCGVDALIPAVGRGGSGGGGGRGGTQW